MKKIFVLLSVVVISKSFAQISCDSLFKLADKAYQQQGPKDAIAVYNRILALHCSDSGLAYSNRGFMYNELEDYKTAIADFEKAVKINPSDHEAYANASVAYNFLNDHVTAMVLVQKAINLAPGNYQYYRLRGDVQYTLDKFDLAIADYKRSIDLEPDYLELYTHIARTYERMIHNAMSNANAKANDKSQQADPNVIGQQLSDFVHAARDSGEAILTLLIKRFPDNKLLIFNRAEFYRRNFLYDKAIPDYLQGIKDNKPDDQLICNLAFCYDGKGDFDSAEKYYTASINVKPNLPAYVNRGRLYKKEDKLAQSIADEDAAIKLDSTYAQAYLIAGNCYLALKQPAKAVTYYKKGLEQNPNGEIKSLLQDQLAAAKSK